MKYRQIASNVSVSPGRAVAILLALSFVACSGGKTEGPPSLVIISVDTLRADALGSDGYEEARTPALDELVAGGVTFRQAFAPMPRTTPALASLLTGLWPQHHGSREVGDPLLGGTTLAEILSARGYGTLAVNANAAAGPLQNLDRGFDRFIAYEDLVERFGEQLFPYEPRVPAGSVGAAEAVSRAALEELASLPEDRSFFLWMHYQDPHFLYAPPADWRAGLQAERCDELYAYFTVHRSQGGRIFSDVEGVASRALEDCRRLYDAEVAYTDHQIGNALKALSEAGRLENTVIVFTADHGENFGEGRLFFEHGNNVHDAGIRVPLAFVGPGIEPGRKASGPVSLVDVLPTLLTLLGVPDEDRPFTDGQDLAPRLHPGGSESRRDQHRTVFAESGSAMWNEAVDVVATGRSGGRVCINGARFTLCRLPGSEKLSLFDHVADPTLERNVLESHPQIVAGLLSAWSHWPPGSARQRAARNERFKLVETPQMDGTYGRRLYDVAADSTEAVDVGAVFPEVMAQLSKELSLWTSELPVEHRGANEKEIEETLRSLGYLR